MKYLLISVPMLLITACASSNVQYLPLYLEQHPERPPPPKIEEVDLGYISTMQLFTLDPAELDDLNSNLTELDKYVALLLLNLRYYEEATTASKEPSAN